MTKKIFILFSLIFLFSCTEDSKNERYFENCVNDGMKVNKWSEKVSAGMCQSSKTLSPDKFKYFKGKVYSGKN